jgi:predicted RNase H-like HicB family nuclease
MDRIYTYTVKISRAHGGNYFATVPMLPGCHVQGDTYEDVLRNVAESIQTYAAELARIGREIPIEPEQHELRLQVQLPEFPPIDVR